MSCQRPELRQPGAAAQHMSGVDDTKDTQVQPTTRELCCTCKELGSAFCGAEASGVAPGAEYSTSPSKQRNVFSLKPLNCT